MTTAAEWHSLGVSLFQKGEMQEARNFFALALTAEPQNGQYMLDYAQAYMELGQYVKAESFFRAALELLPDSPVGNYRFANLLKHFGHLDEAVAKYSIAIAANPGYVEAINNRGAAYHTMGKTKEALADYHRAIDLNPQLEQAYLNLGRLLDSGGNYAGAGDLYRQALAKGLDVDLFTHLLQAVAREPSSKAPLGYVRAIFNDYAGAFDQHLTLTLGYAIPARIGAQVQAIAPQLTGPLAAVDLGCGTGLCGVEIAPFVAHLAGVDASPRMLDHADRRGIYHDLVESDIERYLLQLSTESTDFLTAADVFIYIGALETVFAEAARILRPGGAFIFSIEWLADQDDYRLQRTGRYQHSLPYMSRLCASTGLLLENNETVNLRLEQGYPVPGKLLTARKARSAQADAIV